MLQKEQRRKPTPGEGAPSSTSRARWGLALLVGSVLWFASTFASYLVPSVLLGLDIEGSAFAVVAVLQLVLGLGAVALALKIVGRKLSDIGFVGDQWRTDALIGAAIAVGFALMQFLVVIPNTGGALRSDVVANRAQLGDSWFGVGAFLLLAWFGAMSEELFFRGHLWATLRGLLGPSSWAQSVAVVFIVVVFAASHGYQGWAGVLDTGLYGGLTMTLLYLWRRRLTACIVAHALWNSIASLVLFLFY